MTKTFSIAFDVMGSLHGPEEVVRGAAILTRETPNIQATLVGDRDQIDEALAQVRHNAENLSVFHTDEWIGFRDMPEAAMRTKPRSSIAVAAELVKSGEADALVSAGSPGAGVRACSEVFELIAGVSRPALGAVYPTALSRGETNDPFCLLLDVGAGAEATAEELRQFALMGAAYSRIVSRNQSPRVALLSAGVEAVGEARRITDARALLDGRKGINFIGTIEGLDIPRGAADVIACDGLLGNVALKLLEATSETVIALANSASKEGLPWRLGIAMLSRGIEGLKDLVEWREYGGAPLLGFEAIFMKVHPSSRARAIANAGKIAARAARLQLNRAIAQELRGST